MVSGPIASWKMDGEKVEAVTDFIFLDSRITADSHCSQEIKRHLLLGRKAMTNLCLVTYSYPTLCDHIDFSLPGSSVHGDSPGKNIEVGFYALL